MSGSFWGGFCWTFGSWLVSFLGAWTALSLRSLHVSRRERRRVLSELVAARSSEPVVEPPDEWARVCLIREITEERWWRRALRRVRRWC